MAQEVAPSFDCLEASALRVFARVPVTEGLTGYFGSASVFFQKEQRFHLEPPVTSHQSSQDADALDWRSSQ